MVKESTFIKMNEMHVISGYALNLYIYIYNIKEICKLKKSIYS